MAIKTKLSEADYIKLSFTLVFKKTAFKVLVGLVLAALIVLNLDFLLLPGAHLTLEYKLTPLIFIFFVEAFLWYTLKRNYSSNKRLQETIEYRFDEDFLYMSGESFSAQLSWNKVYKVTQTRDWILIWQTPNGANFIGKKDIGAGDVLAIKNILTTHNVKNTL
jgi:hypothetical protein